MSRKPAPPSIPAHDVLLTDHDAAQRLGVSVSTVRRMRRDREIVTVSVIAFKTNVSRVEPASFAAWLVSRQK